MVEENLQVPKSALLRHGHLVNGRYSSGCGERRRTKLEVLNGSVIQMARRPAVEALVGSSDDHTRRPPFLVPLDPFLT